MKRFLVLMCLLFLCFLFIPVTTMAGALPGVISLDQMAIMNPLIDQSQNLDITNPLFIKYTEATRMRPLQCLRSFHAGKITASKLHQNFSIRL